MNKKIFAKLLTYYLNTLHISHREAAHLFSTAPGTITRWIHGYSAPAQPARIAIIGKLFIQTIKQTIKQTFN